MKLRVVFIVFVVMIFAIGCSPVSHILVGDLREPIDPAKVKVYADFPENFEKVAIIEAGSDFAIKDPAFTITHQDKTDKALERLKLRAAELGANGIVIKNLSTVMKQDIDVWSDGDGGIGVSSSNDPEKAISAIAIYVE